MNTLLALLAAGASVAATVEDNGLRVAVTVSGIDGERAVEMRFADAASGVPLLEADPLAWLYPDDPQDSCATVLAKSQNGTLGSPAISLNSLRVVAAFVDGSLAVLDPHVTFGGTQLESALDLGIDMRAMVASQDGETVLIVPQGTGPALVIETHARPEIATRIPITESAAIATENARFWIFDSLGLRSIEGKRSKTFPIIDWPIEGRPKLLVSHGGDILVGSEAGPIGLMASGVSQVVPLSSHAGLRDGAWLAHAAQWAAVGGDGVLRLLSPGRPATVVAGIDDALAVATDKQGRYVLVLDHGGAELALVDASSGTVLHRQAQSERFDRITTSEDFAYVHSANSTIVQLISFEVIEQAQRISQVELPFGETGQEGGARFSRVGIMPGGATVVGADGRSIYVYAEGMMVPMGTLSGISRQVLGQVVLDRSLREVAPGTFRTMAAVTYGGRYRLPVRLSNPKMETCLTLDLPGPPRPTGPPARMASFVALQESTAPGARVPLALKTNLPGDSIIALATDGTGAWQRHIILRRNADGTLRGVIRFPRPGYYHLIAGPARAAIAVNPATGDGS